MIEGLAWLSPAHTRPARSGAGRYCAPARRRGDVARGWTSRSAAATGSRSRCTSRGRRAACCSASICSSRRCAPRRATAGSSRRGSASARRAACQRGRDLVEGQPDVAGGPDERQPAQHAALVAALVARRPRRVDQALALVEPQGRRREAAARGDLADGQQIGCLHRLLLDFKLTSSSRHGRMTTTSQPVALDHRRLARLRTRPGPRPRRPRVARSSSTPATPAISPARCRELPSVVPRGDVTDPVHRAGAGRAPSTRSAGSTCSSTTPATSAPARCRRSPSYPLDGLREVYETNVVAPLALMQLLLPLLRAQPRHRASNISSDAAVEAYPGWGGYGSSKAALDHAHRRARRRGTRRAGVRLRPGRHAHGDAPGRVPRRGHHRPARARDRRAGAAAAARRAPGQRPLPREPTGPTPEVDGDDRARRSSCRASSRRPRRRPTRRACGCWSPRPAASSTRASTELGRRSSSPGDLVVVNTSGTLAAAVDGHAAGRRRR